MQSRVVELVQTVKELGSANIKIRNAHLIKMRKKENTIFSSVFLMIEKCSMSRLLTTMAGVVKKKRTRKRNRLIKKERRYQNRDEIARFSLYKFFSKNII